MRLKERLSRALEGCIPSAVIGYLPSRYPVIGNALLLRLHKALVPYGKKIGSVLIGLMPNISSVWAISGTERVIRRPIVVHLAGDPNPIVVHKELNTIFRLDISKITFSPGNSGERKKLLSIIDDGDVVLDMFACVGNLSLPIATNKDPRAVVCVELNPYAYRFLLENIAENRVQHIVIPLLKNNLMLKMKEKADHVLLGYLPEPSTEQLAIAVRSVKDGGLVHIHMLSKRGREMDKCIEKVHTIARFRARVEQFSWEFVKSYSPTANHIVMRAYISKG